MNRTQQLMKNTAIIAFGKIGTQLLNFLLLPIYTTILSTTDYGIVDVITTMTMLLLPFVTLQTEQAAFRTLVENREDDEAKTGIISTVIISQLAQILFFVIVFSILGTLYQSEIKYYLLFSVIVYSISETMFQISRGLGKNTTYAIGGLIVSSCTILFNIIFVIFLNQGAKGIMLSTIFANILCIIFIFSKEKIFDYISFRKSSFDVYKKYLKYSLPLVPNAISWWLVNASDRILVLLYLGVSANGILSISHKFSNVFVMVYNIFNLTWMESVSLHINDPDKDSFISNVISSVIRFFTAVCFGIIATLPFVFPYLVNIKFSAAYYQIPIFMLASLFNVILASYSVIYIALKDTKEMAKTSILAGIINVSIILLTINYIGLYAASISSLLTYGSLMIYRYYDIQKYLKLEISKRYIYSSVVIISVIISSYYLGNYRLKLISLVIAIVYALYTNKKIFSMITKEIKSFIKFKRNK